MLTTACSLAISASLKLQLFITILGECVNSYLYKQLIGLSIVEAMLSTNLKVDSMNISGVYYKEIRAYFSTSGVIFVTSASTQYDTNSEIRNNMDNGKELYIKFTKMVIKSSSDNYNDLTVDLSGSNALTVRVYR